MTTGVTIVGDLLRNSADVTAIVPIDRIKAGRLPEGAVTPALLLRTISSVEHQKLKRGSVKRMVDRISVTVRADNYRQQTDAIALIQSAVGGFVGDASGAVRVAARTARTGPDLVGPGNTYEQSQDFRISYEIPA